MELWIRSTAKTNLLQARFLTIMDGKTFYKKNEWEFKGYTICNCTEQGNYEILGTYKTKERALEVLDEIHQRLVNIQCIELAGVEYITSHMKRTGLDCVYEMPEE